MLQVFELPSINICDGSRNKFESFRHKVNLFVHQFFIREVFDMFFICLSGLISAFYAFEIFAFLWFSVSSSSYY